VRIGLTGGVASGKSTVSRILRELGAVVVDADEVARAVVAPGTEGLAAVVTEFGPEVLDGEGALDRRALAARVFGEGSARRRLEAIVHPLVRAEGRRLEAAAPPGRLVVHDIPLLVESGQAGDFDVVVVVDVPEDVQVDRMVRDRGWSEEEARGRLAAQASREDRLAVATYVIDNTGSLADLRSRVEEVYADLAPSAG
jgi:dephospho-CoA kinase